MTKLALGSVQFGLDYGIANSSGKVPRAEIAHILDVARTGGIDLIDTAVAYGDSEAALGEHTPFGFGVVSKLPPLPSEIQNIELWVHNQVRASLQRLRLRSLHGLLLHKSADLYGDRGKSLARSLLKLKEKGLVEKIGVSIYAPEELDPALGVMNLDLVQGPLNVVDRRLEESGWLRRLSDQGIEVHIRSVFLQGLLLMKRSEIPRKFERWSPIWDVWHNLLKERNASALEMCLAYPLSNENVDRVVVGVVQASQLKEIIRSAQVKLESSDCSFMKSGDVELINPGKWEIL